MSIDSFKEIVLLVMFLLALAGKYYLYHQLGAAPWQRLRDRIWEWRHVKRKG